MPNIVRAADQIKHSRLEPLGQPKNKTNEADKVREKKLNADWQKNGIFVGRRQKIEPMKGNNDRTEAAKHCQRDCFCSEACSFRPHKKHWNEQQEDDEKNGKKICSLQRR